MLDGSGPDYQSWGLAKCLEIQTSRTPTLSDIIQRERSQDLEVVRASSFPDAESHIALFGYFFREDPLSVPSRYWLLQLFSI